MSYTNIIQDGTGKGNLAQVDNTNKLEVHGVSESERDEAVEEGKGFEIGTPPVALTVATETALLFIQNDGDVPMVLDRWEFSAAESTGGTSDVCLLKLYQGATGITNSTPGGPSRAAPCSERATSRSSVSRFSTDLGFYLADRQSP
jgi:hypothetical protein